MNKKKSLLPSKILDEGVSAYERTILAQQPARTYEGKTERIKSYIGVAGEVRASASFWWPAIKALGLVIIIGYLALGGIAAITALLKFMPWYIWAIIGLIIFLLLRK